MTEINFIKCPVGDIPYEFRSGPGRCYGDRWYQARARLPRLGHSLPICIREHTHVPVARHLSSAWPSTLSFRQVAQLLDLAVSDRLRDPYRKQLRWALYAQFVVPGWVVRRLPLSFWKVC